MHVASLLLFDKPADAGPDYVNDLYHRLLKFDDLRPLFRKRPKAPVNSVGTLWWTQDDDVDLEYHVRLSSLPAPGRVRELLELVSRLQGYLLDRHRPLWEFHLIEGLQGNRFAMYVKMHHSLVDGVGGVRLIANTLSTDPDEEHPPFWAVQRSGEAEPAREPRPSGLAAGLEAAKAVTSAVRDLAGGTPTMATMAVEALRGQAGQLSFPAPKTMFNGPITGARRFAAQSWDVDQLRKARSATGATMNDVILAMCAGSLRRYLIEQEALPNRPLVAAVPVSLAHRTGVTNREGGNSVGMVLCDLATDEADPRLRLERISGSMRRTKEQLAALNPMQILALSAVVMGAPTLLASVPGFASFAPPLFNLIISNVPGPRRPLYFNGAKLEGMYPVSVPYEGQALNMTVLSYAGKLGFGVTGCRRTVPHLQRLLTYLDESLTELVDT
jgi:WS/DGAT/MGAT family acyltransferase